MMRLGIHSRNTFAPTNVSVETWGLNATECFFGCPRRAFKLGPRYVTAGVPRWFHGRPPSGFAMWETRELGSGSVGFAHGRTRRRTLALRDCPVMERLDLRGMFPFVAVVHVNDQVVQGVIRTIPGDAAWRPQSIGLERLE